MTISCVKHKIKIEDSLKILKIYKKTTCMVEKKDTRFNNPKNTRRYKFLMIFF